MLIKRLKGNTADLDKIIKAGEKSPVFQLFMEQVRKSPNQSIRQAIIPQQLLQKKQSHIIEQAGQLVHDQLKANLRNLRQISKERPSRSVTIPFGAKMREAGEQLYAPNKRIYHGVAKDTRIPQYISPIAQRQHFTPYPEIGGGYADSIMVGYPTHSLKQSPRYTAHLGMPSEAGDFERWQRQQAIKRGEYSIASPHVEWSSRPDYETVIDVPKDKLKYYLIDKNFRGIDRSKHGEGLPNGPRDQTLRGNYYDAPLKGVAQRDITITPISKQELFKHVPAAAARAQELKEHAKQLDLNLIADHLNRMTKDIFKPFSREVAPNDYW
jgi:hypothetical protein